ncbi:MAG: hypothetical protein RIR51_1122 [Bacteroidota bacterium]
MHLYFHIPYCHLACHYCDFHFSTNLKTKNDLVNAMVQELEISKNYLSNKNLETIYFGGGTPSILSKDDFQKIFEKIHSLYSINKAAEITIETNPEDINKENLLNWKSLNINRLSIGIQTLNDDILKKLNRNHTKEDSLKAIELCKKFNFNVLTTDLIYGLPGQTEEILKEDIKILAENNIPHISAYNLTIEPNTVFGKWKKEGKLIDFDNHIHAEYMEILFSELVNYGYENYEISNFAKNQAYSVHNTAYWRNEEYLGIGPSAHSFNYSSRQWNIANNPKYIQFIKEGKDYFEKEELTEIDKINEYILTNIRTKWGLNLSKLKDDFSRVNETFPNKYLENLQKLGLARIENEFLILNFEGKLLADEITLELMIEE